MEHIGMKLTEEHVRWAALGGSILGGGGGGSAKTGAEFGDLAVRFSQLELTPLDQIDPETVVVTASMVGAPAAQEKFVSPADMMRCVELFTQSTGIRPGGIVTNENGGGSTFNGWLEASMLGIPLIDAPCNGRAHPTGVMGSLLLRIHSLRQLEQLLILLCFFSSMLITNDVALITFVPFALELLRMVNRKDRIVPVVVCQTLAANLGSMTTPVGNPQNLYLYSHFELSLDTFIRSIGPFSLLSLVLLLLVTMFTPRETISLDTAGRDTTSDETFPKRCLFCCLGMFFLCLCTVAGLLPLPILFICILAIGCLADPKIFCQVDYSLILTFIGFFIFIGNLKHIPAVSSLLSSMITGHEVIVSVLASQVISNVPAAILLSGFTEKGVSLLIGTNLGGLGTLIASMASLISYKYIVRSCPEKKGIYFRWFTIANAGFLAVLMAVYFLVFYSI